MEKGSFFVAVCADGKYVDSYYAYDSETVAAIRDRHKGFDITILDQEQMRLYTEEEFDGELERRREAAERALAVAVVQQQTGREAEDVKIPWERPVRCVESGRVFRTMVECSEKMGIPYMTIVNCIKRGNATRGLHFVYAE